MIDPAVLRAARAASRMESCEPLSVAGVPASAGATACVWSARSSPRGDLGVHTVLAGETLELGERTLPAAHTIRFQRSAGGELVLEARVGPYWRPWMRTTFERSLEPQVLPGTYRVSAETGPVPFEVPGASTVVIPE